MIQGSKITTEPYRLGAAHASVTALSMMIPWGPPEKQALLESPDHAARARTLIAITEMALASANLPSTPLQ